ncbi:AMP-dependent synthetase and ligase [metagenome]|uniref:AMP-dependent synthetase and ligase n=1 Tax=metagenome TaxID=256318 RepID=A0A2P2CEU5_9ZZZZ
MTAPSADPSVEALAGLPDLDPTWSRQVTVTDATGRAHTWHLLDNGAEPVHGTLLCVHGNPTWSYLWRRLLAGAPTGWRVIAPDHLGMGYSERLTAPRTLAQRVQDLGDLTAALDVTGPVITVGHDWGGAISLGWALAHRDQLRGVVLTNTAVAQPEGDRGPALIRMAHVPALRELSCVRTPLFVRATSALSRPALPSGVRDALAAPYATPQRRRSVGDFVADIPFAGAHPSRDTVEAIAEGVRSLDVPALLLWGPRDPVFGEKYLADLRERLPHAELHRYEGASHLVTEDAPAYVDAIGTWLGDLGASQRPGSHQTAEASTPPGAPLWAALDERRNDPAPAVVEVGGATLSWRELDARVRDLAAGLAAIGVRPGHRVALLVEPSADLTVAVYAVWRAGAVIVVADKGLGFAGMRRALRGASVDHVIGASAGLAAARAMRLPGTRIAAGRARRVLGAIHDLTSLTALGHSLGLPAEPDADQECAVVFTSGATGPAKGVVYRHRQVAAQLELLRTTYAVKPDDRLVAAFAPFALLGPALGIGSAVPDIDVTAPGTLTAVALADAAAAIDATIVFASPAALRNVLATAGELDPARRAVLGRVRLLMSAGAPVPAALLESLASVLPAAQAHTPYGMTEALPVTDVSLSQILAAGPGEGVCVGLPLPGVDVALSALSVDGAADGELSTEPGRTGEICVRADHVKDRYDALWATERQSSREPGWHRTGDVGHLDDEGRLWVEGRLVHLVTPASGVLTPVPVEQRVEALDSVRSAAVVGVGPAGTQAVVVVVVPEADAPRGLTSADSELRTAVRDAAGVEVSAVLLTRALPVDIRHASKIDRREVARRAGRVLAGSRQLGR